MFLAKNELVHMNNLNSRAYLSTNFQNPLASVLQYLTAITATVCKGLSQMEVKKEVLSSTCLG